MSFRNLDPEKFIHVGFTLPIINGQIYLAQRGTEPQKGKWGAVGGKAEPRDSVTPQLVGPQIITKFNGQRVPSLGDRWADYEGREWPANAALREAVEELYAQEDISQFRAGERLAPYAMISLGVAVDHYKGRDTECEFYAAWLKDAPFSPSTREITGIKALSEIDPNEIWPMSQLALAELAWKHETGYLAAKLEELGASEQVRNLDKLISQIPIFTPLPDHRGELGGVPRLRQRRGNHPYRMEEDFSCLRNF